MARSKRIRIQENLMSDAKEIKQKLKQTKVIGLFEVCDLCGNDVPIHTYNRRSGDYYQDVIEFTGKQFLCQRCRKE